MSSTPIFSSPVGVMNHSPVQRENTTGLVGYNTYGSHMILLQK